MLRRDRRSPSKERPFGECRTNVRESQFCQKKLLTSLLNRDRRAHFHIVEEFYRHLARHTDAAMRGGAARSWNPSGVHAHPITRHPPVVRHAGRRELHPFGNAVLARN